MPERGDRIRILEGALQGDTYEVISLKPGHKGLVYYELRDGAGHTWVLSEMPRWEQVG